MNITAKRFNYLLTGVLISTSIIALLVTFYSLRLYSERSAKLVETKLELVEANSQRDNALTQKADLSKNKTDIELLQKIVPKTKDQALAVAELQAIANENNLSIGNLSFPASELGAVKNNTTAGASEKITQTKNIEGMSGVLGIELNISQINRKLSPVGSGINYNQLIDLLKSIEKNRRTMQIKTIQIQPIIKEGAVVGYNPTITINLFVKP